MPSLVTAVADQSHDELSPAQFARISELLHRLCGIDLQVGKECLVKARLAKRLRALGLRDFDEYVQYIERDGSGQELLTMIDSLSTNKTSFFREEQHFEFLREHVLPGLCKTRDPIRIWSAGCSSGEEPYSLAIILAESILDIRSRDVRILATDISTKVLAAAREAVYPQDVVRDVPAMLLNKYFKCVQTAPSRLYSVNDQLKAMVRLARLNLMEAWPMAGPFDVIFCRNVMIYFDRPTRETLVRRFWDLLPAMGYLFIGHAESLSGLATEFRYVQPAVYRK
jgi:chemotaxis protein methyltransferase CheR